MKKWMRALALAVWAFVAAPARAADRLELQVGVRAGYVFGRGLTLGPLLSFGARLSGDVNQTSRPLTVLGAVVIAADVSLVPGGPWPWRLHAGAEVKPIWLCPVLALPVAAGAVWSREPAGAVQPGWELSVAPLVAALQPRPEYAHPAREPQLLAGAYYRYARVGLSAPAAIQHEVGADARLAYLPFDGRSLEIGYCGGD